MRKIRLSLLVLLAALCSLAARHATDLRYEFIPDMAHSVP